MYNNKNILFIINLKYIHIYKKNIYERTIDFFYIYIYILFYILLINIKTLKQEKKKLFFITNSYIIYKF